MVLRRVRRGPEKYLQNLCGEFFGERIHLRHILDEAQTIVSEALRATPEPKHGGDGSLSGPHQQTVAKPKKSGATRGTLTEAFEDLSLHNSRGETMTKETPVATPIIPL